MDPLTLIIVVLLILWLVGAFVVPIGSSLVHLLLVVVLVILVIRVARGEKLL